LAFFFTFSSSGIKTLAIKLDPNNILKESNESNNDYSFNLTVTTPTPTPTPKLSCGATCQSSDGCSAGLICYQPALPPCNPGMPCMQTAAIKVCRNPECRTNTGCVCGSPTPTARPVVTPTPSVKPTPTPFRPTPTPYRPTPTPVPVCRLKILGFCLIY